MIRWSPLLQPGPFYRRQTEMSTSLPRRTQSPGSKSVWRGAVFGDGWQRQGRRPWRWLNARQSRHRQAALDAATRIADGFGFALRLYRQIGGSAIDGDPLGQH